jgi:hypothetical protein
MLRVESRFRQLSQFSGCGSTVSVSGGIQSRFESFSGFAIRGSSTTSLLPSPS